MIDKSHIVLGIICLSVLGLAFNSGYNVAMHRVEDAPVKTDTVWKTRTIYSEAPEPKTRLIIGTIPVPVPLPVPGDTIHDSTIVYLPMEQKIYQDSTYKLQISGYNANLDWIETYQRTQIVTNTVVMPRKRFGISVGAGPAVIYSPFHNTIDAGVGVFGGFTYTF